MKKILLILLLLLTVKVYSQNRIDTLTFYSGVPTVVGDSLREFYYNGLYQWIYVIIQDTTSATGTHYTDSVKCYAITRRLTQNDSVVSQCTMRLISGGTYADYGSSSQEGTTSKYLILDAYVDKILLVWSNSQFITGRRCKITLMCMTRNGN